MDWFVDWLSWVYGKWFVGHPWRGFLTLMVPIWLGLFLILGAFWLKAIDGYKDKQATPKPQTATVTNNSVPAPQNVTVNVPAQGMPVANATRPTAKQRKQHTIKPRPKITEETLLPKQDTPHHSVPTVYFAARCLSTDRHC